MTEITIASAWRRILAGAIDLILILSILLFIGSLIPISKLTASILIIPYVTLGLLYVILFHAKSGQTIGKAVLGIRVLKLNSKKIGWREALRRSSVDIFLSLHWVITIPLLVWQLPNDNFVSQGWTEMYHSIIKPALPTSFEILEYLGIIWGLSEFVTMLFNKKRRALHDFLAGTIVVQSRFKKTKN